MRKTKSGIFVPELMIPPKTIKDLNGLRGEIAILVHDRTTGILKRKIGGGNTILGQFNNVLAEKMFKGASAAWSNTANDTYSFESKCAATEIAGGTPAMTVANSKGATVLHLSSEPTGSPASNSTYSLSGNIHMFMTLQNDADDPGGDGSSVYFQEQGIFDEGVAYNKTGWLMLATALDIVAVSGSLGTGFAVGIAKYAQNINITSAEKVHVHWKITFA